MLFIKVEEVPRPQFRGKSSRVCILRPSFSVRKSGLSFLASPRIFESVFEWLFAGFEGLKLSNSKNSENQTSPFSSKLFQWTPFFLESPISRDCPNFVGM